MYADKRRCLLVVDDIFQIGFLGCLGTIDAPYPRTEEFRTSRVCNDYCREVSARLMEAVTGVASGKLGIL